MSSRQRWPRKSVSVWEPVAGVMEDVEQALVAGLYPARRMLMSRFSEASGRQLPVWVPEADVEETARDIFVSFDLPGVDKADIRVSVSETTLTVSGRRRETSAARDAQRRELITGEFLRRVRLPDEIKPGSTRAAYRNGVLRVAMARAHAQAGRSVKVE